MLIMLADELPLIETAFIISGDGFDPHSCAAIFNLAPTTVTVRGEQRPGKRPKVATTSWCVEVQRRAKSIDEVLQELLDTVWPHKDAIRAFTQSVTLKTTFTAYVKIFAERPLYCLNPATVERMAHFQAEFCLDIFDLSG
jgi:hypothetical protein